MDLLFDGGSNDTGFVQVMQGRAKDQQQMRDRQKEIEPELRKLRPDLIGGITAWHGDGSSPKLPTSRRSKDARKNEQAMTKCPVYDSSSRRSTATYFYDLTRLDLD